MLLPTIKPVYSGTYFTGYLKIQEICKVQTHKVQETMQGDIKVDPPLNYSSFHEDIWRYRGRGPRVLNVGWSIVVSFTSASLWLWRETPQSRSGNF
jgi:hypothetical protein